MADEDDGTGPAPPGNGSSGGGSVTERNYPYDPVFGDGNAPDPGAQLDQDPSGGLYAALADLMGGQTTGYEDSIGNFFQQLMQGGMGIDPANGFNGIPGFENAGSDLATLIRNQGKGDADANSRETSIWDSIQGLMGGPSANMNNVLGNYQWMASGLPTDAESELIRMFQGGASGNVGQRETDVEGRYKDFSGKDAFGYELDSLNAFKDLGKQTQLGGDIEGALRDMWGNNPYGGVQSGAQGLSYHGYNPQETELKGAYEGFGAGPNTREQDVYGKLTDLSAPGQTASEADLTAQFKKYGTTQGDAEREAFNRYKGMGQGYTPAQQDAIATEAIKATRQGYDQARDRMARQAAATGASTGYFGSVGQAARDEANAVASQARQNQLKFADEAIRQNEVGAGGLANLANVESRRGEFGLSGQASMGDKALARQMGALGAMGQQNAAQRGYQESALAGRKGMLDAATNREFTGLGLQKDAADARSQQQFGAISGAQGLEAARQAAKQASAQGQQGWAQDFTGRQIEGTKLADQWNQNYKNFQQQQQDRYGEALQRLRDTQLAGTKGAQDWEAQVNATKAGAINQGQDWTKGFRDNQKWAAQQGQSLLDSLYNRQNQNVDRQLQGAEGSNKWAEQSRGRQSDALAKMLGLFQQQDPLEALGAAAGLITKPRETYTEGGGSGFSV